MRSTLVSLAGALSIVLGVMRPAVAEVVTLRSGEQLAGSVRTLDNDSVLIRERFPALRTVRLHRDDFTRESWFQIVERRAEADSAMSRWRLARLAEDLGLKGLAIAEYRRVEELDSATTAEVRSRIEVLEESIAQAVLAEALALRDHDLPRASLTYLHSIRERYPRTRAARTAANLIATRTETALPVADTAEDRIDLNAAEKLLARVIAHLRRAQEATARTVTDEPGPHRFRIAVDAIVAEHESAWLYARALPVTTSETEVSKRHWSTKEAVLSALVDAYLFAGWVHIETGSTSAATAYCNSALDVVPYNARVHRLHSLLLDRKATFGDLEP